MKEKIKNKKILLLIALLVSLVLVKYNGLAKVEYQVKERVRFANQESLYFEEDSYSCSIGDEIETIIHAPVSSSGQIQTISSYTSDNPTIATISKDTDHVLKCIDCLAVKINCVKSGTVTLNAVATNGSTASSSVRVLPSGGAIPTGGSVAYEESNYSCTVGETIHTRIKLTSGSNNVFPVIESMYASDPEVATVERETQIVTNCIDCIAVNITCKKAGNVTLETTSTNTSVRQISNLTVVDNTNAISFEKDNYTCNHGQVIRTTITATGRNEDSLSTVDTYESTDPSIASIDKDLEYMVKCPNCLAVKITCNKAGYVKLKATSSMGAKVEVPVSVDGVEETTVTPTETQTITEEVQTPKVGTISYEKEYYKCIPGKSFVTRIIATPADPKGYDAVKSFSSSNKKIATISINKEGQSAENIQVKVKCKKSGTVKLKATSTSGAKTTSTVYSDKSKGKIKYAKKSYKCSPGQVIRTTITATYGKKGIVPTVKSFSTSNKKIATIERDDERILKCINCVAVKIKCKKSGNVRLYAKSSLGAKVNISLKVDKKVGKIKYAKKSYKCVAGTSFVTTIKTTPGKPGIIPTVKSFKSSNSKIATIEESTDLVTNCIDCKAVKITCKKKGTARLYATSSTGAKTNIQIKVNNK